MATVIKKTVFLHRDLWDAVRSSRRLQRIIILAFAALLLVGYLFHRYDAQRAAIFRSAQEKDSLTAQLFDFNSIGSMARTIAMGVDTRGTNQSLAEIVNAAMKENLEAAFPKSTFATGVLLPGFYNPPYFDETFQGSRKYLVETDFFVHVPTLLLIRPEISLKPSVVGAGMQSCTIDVICHSYSAKNGSPVEVSVHLTGIGSTAESSIRNAINGFGENKSALTRLIQ